MNLLLPCNIWDSSRKKQVRGHNWHSLSSWSTYNIKIWWEHQLSTAHANLTYLDTKGYASETLGQLISSESITDPQYIFHLISKIWRSYIKYHVVCWQFCETVQSHYRRWRSYLWDTRAGVRHSLHIQSGRCQYKRVGWDVSVGGSFYL